MLFSINKIINIYINKIIKNNKMLHSLQISRQNIRLKRVFLSASFKGGMTIEASIVTTVFLLTILYISGFMVSIKLQQDIRMVLNNMARSMAQTIYYEEQIYEVGKDLDVVKQLNDYVSKATDMLAEEEKEELLKKVDRAAFDMYAYAAFIGEMGAEEINNSYIVNGVLGLDFTESKYDESQGTIAIILKYYIKIPYISEKFCYFKDSQSVYVKAWNGRDIAQDKETVYITPKGSAYHTSRKCRYIDIDVSGVTFAELKRKRNYAGGRYRECESCGAGNYKENTEVYITDNGEKYHSTQFCSQISRTVMAIDKKDIGDRNLCEKCGEG